MFDRKELTKALRGLDADACVRIVGIGGLRDAEVAEQFVLTIRQTGCLLIKYPDPNREKRREALVQKCRDLISACKNEQIANDFETHLTDSQAVEKGFREILNSLQQSEISKLSAPEQAWGMIHRSAREFTHVKAEIEKEIAKHAGKKRPSLDSRQLKITTENGRSISPDAVISGIVKGVSNTLAMLAIINKWFDGQTGEAVFPPETTDDETIAFQAGAHTLLSSQWEHLEKAWDRSRLFKARVRLRDDEFRDGGQQIRRCTVLEIQSPGRDELLERVAQDRLLQVFFQTEMDLELSGVKMDTTAKSAVSPFPLAPDGYIGREEVVTSEVLDGTYCIPVIEGTQLFEGLPLKVWVRGYAHLAKLARTTDGQPILELQRSSKDDLVAGFVNAGLSHEQANRFISLTTFQKDASDLFDTPLLKTADGDFYFFAAAYQSPVLGVILLSRLASLNRRRNENGEIANDCHFDDKGKRFERQLLQLLKDKGIEAHGFKYRLAGVDYDCDAAALFGDTLFIFECKNYSLPMGHLSSLYYFALEQVGFKKQVKRIVEDLTQNTAILTPYFGATIRWKRIVPVVLYALPYSAGISDGVYVYDASAFSHLLKEGFTSVSCLSKMGNNYVRRRHRYSLKQGAIPTASELEQEMANPNQLRLHVAGLEQRTNIVPISEQMVFSLPEWRQKTITLKEQLLALGSSAKEAETIARDMNEVFPAALAKIRQQRVDGPKSRRKIGRNDPCPCGSGTKFKKCCLGKSGNI